MSHEVMECDVVIIGGGPAGLSASIRLAQIALAQNQPINICLVDKGAAIGSHILSGAVLDPRALDELIPDWKTKNAPLLTPVKEDRFTLLTEKRHFQLPTPPQMHNAGNYIISLGQLCQWLALQAEALGVNIFSGFVATEAIFENNCVRGVILGDKGVDRHGQHKANFQPGIALHAKQIILAEGCRGSLSEQLFSHFKLREHCDPQTYGLGIKEVWEIPADCHQPGLVTHTIGWPLSNDTYGGSFAYHYGTNLLSIGFVIGLDYRNPYLNPYEELQRFKTHPSLYSLLKKSKRIAYGARTLIEGGMQSLPKLSFDGGIVIGDAAGFLNVPKIKGIHTAMKSGMVAAESLYPLLASGAKECLSYQNNLEQSWLWDELYRARNIRPAMSYGLFPGLLYAAIDTYLLRGRAPWTLHHRRRDRDALMKAVECQKIPYPKHDNEVTFDLMNSVYLTNISYVEDQPYHLKIKNRSEMISINYTQYASPETRYCPAGVYEIVFPKPDEPRFQVNGGNCIQCKACDIKDPTQNILWTPSEGGSGPQYQNM